MSESMEKAMRMRTYVLKEMLKTEKDYVETLRFVVQVFKERLDGREKDENDKLIPEGTVNLLLANINELLEFHGQMLSSIEEALSPEPNFYHEIGGIFLKFKEKFKLYEPYCTNHERAQKKLNELTENQEFQGFILGCLLLGNYINDVSMEGFLLTPIQRICKYPLLLKELLKKTPRDHSDYNAVKEACEIMKDVCSNVNETKRQLEQLEKLEELQATFVNWEGVNLTDTCTRLIKQGTLLKISVGNFQERQFFLFDHLLVYGKKITMRSLPTSVDVKTGTLRRTRPSKAKTARDQQKKWVFKGRISTELMEIENLEDGCNDYHCGGSTVTNGWKVLNAAKNKWFVLVAKDKEEKESWLNEFIMEREKRKSKVNLDQRDNVDVIHAKGKKLYYKLTHQNLIRDRKHKMRTYPKSFSGSDFVSWLVENCESSNADEAVLFGQALLDCGLIHHVQDKHHFRNESILYRFRYDDGSFKPRGENQDLVAKGMRVYCRLHCLFQPVIRDKDKHWKNHKYVVEGKKLVDWLVEHGDCQNRDEASNFGQTMCENGILHHASDKQDFKDDSSLFRFYPDEDVMEISKLRELIKKSSNKSTFKLQESYCTKTLVLLNVSSSEALGIELKFCAENSQVLISSVEKGSHAQIQGFKTGMVILQLNNVFLTSCPSEEVFSKIWKYNLENFKLLHFVIKYESEEIISIPITEEGMGFQIRGSNPCVVHSVAKESAALDSGLLKGHAIFKVNGNLVTQVNHDDVAVAIREGCKLPAAFENSEEQRKNRSLSQSSEEDSKYGSSSSLSTPPTAIKRGKSIKRPKQMWKAALASKENKEAPPEPAMKRGPHLDLLVGNRHLERCCLYNYVNVNCVRTRIVEKMSETPSLFDLAAQLLEIFAAEDTKVLEDVQQLEKIAPFVAELKSEVFDRRKSLRTTVIQERLDEYRKFKRHLASYMWPSYKKARDRTSRMTAKDFCPTNCHVNLMTVSHTAEKYNLKGFGLNDSKGENEIYNVENMVNTTHSVTCAATPFFRTKLKGGGHGLKALLSGAEGNTEVMNAVRQLMVSLDTALMELNKGEHILAGVLEAGIAERDKRYSMQSVSQRDSYPAMENIDEHPTTPMSPFRLNPVPSPKIKAPIIEDESNENQSITAYCNGSVEKSNSLGVVSDNEVNEKKLEANARRSPSVVIVQTNNETGTVVTPDSDCDSGIHSNRESMVVKERSENFTEQTETEDKINRTSGISSGISSERLSVSEDQRTLKGATSMPSLSSPPPLGNHSADRVRSPKKRPRSGRNRLSCLSTAESTCSSDEVESLNFSDLDLSTDGLDKLHGTMEHFMSKIQNLTELVRSSTVQTVFENTKETTPGPERSYEKIIEGFTVSANLDSLKMSLSVCTGAEQFSDVINTLIENVSKHVNEVRTQLVLSVLLNEDPKLIARRDKVFSQALIIAISSFSTQLRCAIAGTFNNMKGYGVRAEDSSRKWLEQCMSIGVCILFQTMLNPNEPDECAMLEDSCIGVYDLERVSFHFKAITSEVEPNECPYNVDNNFDGSMPVHIDGNGVGYSMEGNRCALKVYFHLEKHVFIKLPPRLQAGGGVKLIPVLINHGLHDLGNLLYEHGVSMQEFSNSINDKAFERIYDYYKRFRAFHFDRSKLPRDTEARAVHVDKLSRPLNTLDEVVTLIEMNVRPSHGKPCLAADGCGILPLTAEYCQRVGACSVVACHNGIHRSTIACCLQQAFALATCHGLPPKNLMSAAYQMGKEGSRSYSEIKNPETSNRNTNNIPRLFRQYYEEAEVTSPS